MQETSPTVSIYNGMSRVRWRGGGVIDECTGRMAGVTKLCGLKIFNGRHGLHGMADIFDYIPIICTVLFAAGIVGAILYERARSSPIDDSAGRGRKAAATAPAAATTVDATAPPAAETKAEKAAGDAAETAHTAATTTTTTATPAGKPKSKAGRARRRSRRSS